MTRWGLVIDLRKCIGCQACTTACEQANSLLSGSWRRVVDCGVNEAPNRQRLSLPMGCMHCSEAPCLEVCPTTATYRRPDGIVDVNHDLCIGCGYCVLACPYMARSIVFRSTASLHSSNGIQPSGSATDPNLNYLGVCTKCNFCLSRVEAGLAQGLRPGVDTAASPACVVSCHSCALYFGDLEDPDSEVSRMLRVNKTVHLQEELGTEPAVHYIVP